MPTVVRKNGTRVTTNPTPAERVAAFRQIVTDRQYAKIDGVMVDLFSASAVVAVCDALSPAAQEKFSSFTAPAMVSIAFKLTK